MKRKYNHYKLRKIYFKIAEVKKRLNISSYILKNESKKLFPHKWREYQNGKKMKYCEEEIEALRLSLYNAKNVKAIAKMVTLDNPDRLFDGFKELVELQNG